MGLLPHCIERIKGCVDSAWKLLGVRTGAKKEVLFNKLKNEWFAEFGIDSLPAERFYDKKEYAKYLKIKSNEFNAYYEE